MRYLFMIAALCFYVAYRLAVGPVVTGAIAVVSDCGVVAVVLETSQGAVLIDHDNQEDPKMVALRKKVAGLDHEHIHMIAVPCPIGARA